MRLVWCLLWPEDELHNLHGTLLPPTAHSASAKPLAMEPAADRVGNGLELVKAPYFCESRPMLVHDRSAHPRGVSIMAA